MRIGIVGIGVVGGALEYGFEKLGHEVFTHDTNMNTLIDDVLYTEIVYICVPTPQNKDGSCDSSIVKSVVKDLIVLNYKGVIAIKSTCSPGTTQELIDENKNTNICFVPEFLRERCAVHDFTEDHQICIVGSLKRSLCYGAVVKSHGSYPNEFIRLSPTEAEVCKYFHNTHNAMSVVFANAFYEICNAMGADYTAVKNAVVSQRHIFDMYLDCNENFRGFGGVCLPKDVSAIRNLTKKMHLDIDLFDAILTDNKKYTATVFEGMRKS